MMRICRIVDCHAKARWTWRIRQNSFGSGGKKYRPSVLMVSAVGNEGITEDAFAKGADYYIMKPFDQKTIHSIVSNLYASVVMQRIFNRTMGQKNT